MRVTQFLKRCVSTAVVECIVVELHRGGSAINGATLSSHIQVYVIFLYYSVFMTHIKGKFEGEVNVCE